MAVAMVSTGKETFGASKGFPKLEINTDFSQESMFSNGSSNLVTPSPRPPRSELHGHGAHLQQATGQEAPAAMYYSISQFTDRTELYTGSVSTVCQAIDVSSGARVVIKAYHKDKMQPKHHYKLEREIQAMMDMNGSFVTELYGTFEDEANIYLVMEYCEGGDLYKTMLKHGGRLDEHYVCVEIIAPLLRVLEKMHSQGLMHRDIKPENIFLTRRGRLRLGDFGLAVNWHKELPFSRSGTLDYMAPEVLQNPSTQLQESPSVELSTLQAKKIKPFTCAVDVWACGVLAYELVCGRPPFEVADEETTVTHILCKNDIRFFPCFSPQWASFVRYALLKDPKQRPEAKGLLTHPWIQSNLQRAIANAPSALHRQAKEELLRPLSLARRSVRIPTARAHAPASPATSASAMLATPLTPQPVRAGGLDAARQMQYLHSHFSSSSSREAGGKRAPEHRRIETPPATPSAGSSPQVAHNYSMTQQAGTPQQHMQAASAYKASYRASPLSKSTAYMQGTPTKSTPAAAACTQGDAEPANPQQAAQQYQLQRQQQLQAQRMAPPHAAPAPSPYALPTRPPSAGSTMMEALQQKLMALSASNTQNEALEANNVDVQFLMQNASAHGAVHIVRNSAAKAPSQQQPSMKQSEQINSPLLNRQLVNGGSSSGEEGMQVSPGPGGPGLKERLKWHLSRQAGP